MKKVISVIFLLGLSALVYHQWLTFKIFSFGDYVYYTRESLLSYFPLSVWRGNFDMGSFDVLLWRLPQQVLYYFGSRIGLDFNILDRFIVFWPWIILSILPIYILLNKIVKTEKAKIIGVLVFSFNTYFLSISTQGHLLISIASGFSVLTFTVFIKFIEKREVRYIPICAILLTIVGIYDLRILYITIWLLLIYAIYRVWVDRYSVKTIIGLSIKLVSIFTAYLGLNLFWFLPTISSISSVNESILERSLFGNEFLNILYAYSLFHPFWTGGQPAWFEVQQINPISWMLPILAFFGIILGRKNKIIVFFSLICVMGIFLTKQASIPLSNVYEFLFRYLPGFSAFREASKFFYIISLAYAVLIAYFIEKIRDFPSIYKSLSYVCLFLILFAIGFNIKPVISGDIGSLFIEREIASDYKDFYNYTNSQNEFFRILWVPRPTRWINASNLHPQVSLLENLNANWQEYRSDEVVHLYTHGKMNEADIAIAFLKSSVAQSLFESASIKYIVLPISDPKNADDIYGPVGKDRTEFYEVMKNLSFLKEIKVGNGNLKVFELSSYKPLIYTSSNSIRLELLEQHPSIYKLKISQSNNKFDLFLTNKFNPQWHAFIGDASWVDSLKLRKPYITPNATSAKTIYYSVNPQTICSEPDLCNKDENGYSFELTLYFRPQAYFVVGSLLTIFVLLISFAIILCRSFIKK